MYKKNLYIVSIALILCCTGAVSALAQKNTATNEFYPRLLGSQLQRIANTSANLNNTPLRETCTAILNDINTIALQLEQNQAAEIGTELERLEQSIRALEAILENWTLSESAAAPYIPSKTALEEVITALRRRMYVWTALSEAETVDASPLTTLYGKNFDDIDRLQERTYAAGQYFMRLRRPANNQTGQTWCDYLETHSWLIELEASRQPSDHSIRLVSLASPNIPVEILKTLSNRANTTLLRLESPSLTNEQRAFLNHPTVRTWKEELQNWTSDTVMPIAMLPLLEQYEATGGMTDMRALAQFLDLLAQSKTPEYRELSNHIRQQYDMPNVRIFLSRLLLNNHLPPPASEIASFREVIQSQPVIGRRQTATEFQVSFISHPTRVLTSLDVGVDLSTISRSDAFATKLFNTGQTMVVARKLIELTETGFRTEPAQARIVDHRMRLVGVNTEFDNMPLVSGLFRNVVRNQYESRIQDANTETRRKILQQVRAQIDRETEQRLRPINETISRVSQYVDEEFALRVEQRESRTDEHWLLTSWGIRSAGALSSNTPAPETQFGALADLKIHESLPNMLLGKLEFEGQHGTVRDFKEMLAEKFQQPGLARPAENDDVEVMFASHNPVVVRFVDGRAEITISLAALRLLNQTHRNFQVIVRYIPAYDDEGRLVLKRDGYISLPTAPREQFVLRAAFAKIFPTSRPLPLVPKVLENDSQFDYLTTGHCRIENGWLAIALVLQPEV
ncbi:MAG: hypothetical protein FWG73_08605 [Planctomycetaceae bacterium]|nr:hypothetical protein [Planctomycetaceae bacterium]